MDNLFLFNPNSTHLSYHTVHLTDFYAHILSFYAGLYISLHPIL